MSQMGNDGAFRVPESKQAQSKPGLEKNMAPPSETTRLESSAGLVEYVGSNKLKDKKALITGGDSGIGRSIAVLMAREGADITIVYLPQEQDDANKTKELIESAGHSCLLISGDLRSNQTCEKAVKEHVDRFKGINILVNNASQQYMCKDFTQTDLGQAEDLFRTNVLQMFAITKYALPYMSKGDSIINNSSVVTFRGSSSMIDYASTKGAIVGFTRSLALQLAPKGIRVNAVAPGAIYTPIQVDTRDPNSMEGFGSNSQLGRPGQPSEVAPSFVFLASKDASLYSGQTLHCYPLGD